VELHLHDPDMHHQMRALASGFEILTKIVTPEHHIPKIAEQAKEIIQTNYSQSDLNVEMLAEQLHIHRVSLSRIFTNALGISPVKYLSQTRMRAAMELLSSTELTIKEIALQCGFTSDGYFVKMFREQMKQTPREFRLLYGKKDLV
jgi:two-component system response regulator YesN